MIQISNRLGYKLTRVLLSAALVAFILINSLPTSAAQLQDRTLHVSTAIPSQLAQHFYEFGIVTPSIVSSISFEYCSNSPLIQIVCVPPVGLDSSSATLASQTVNTGFTFDAVNSTVNKIIITRPAGPVTTAQSTYSFDNVVNTSVANATVFVRMSVHTSADGSGVYSDEGSVAYSTGLEAFSIGAYVPPYLTFCVGQTVETNCSSVGGLLINFGEFSESTPATSTTQFSVATNDATGYNVFVSGQTLTAGNNIIDPLSTSASSQSGVSQFGLNLRSNSSPSVGSDSVGVGTGVPDSAYGSTNSFRFVDGERIALSTLPSEFTKFTVSYVANISDTQAPGVYATTLTYLAVVSF